MLDFLNIEKQVSKRLLGFLTNAGQAAGIPPGQARLVINTRTDNPAGIHLYDGQRYVRTFTPDDVAGYFGKPADPQREPLIRGYLAEKAAACNLPPEALNVLVIAGKDGLSAHLYAGEKYLYKLSLVEVVGHFNSRS